ncbi:MAG: FtsX-like permease family protein [Lautropia sp.]|nr:FtsX-like permease family protein [Lautropia sp.]
MNTFSLALRNVLRNRRRTLITLGAIGVAAAAIVVLGGYVSATLKGLQTLTVRDTGHLHVMTEGWLEFGRADPGQYALRDADTLERLLEEDDTLRPMLRVVTPMLQLQGVAGYFESGNSSTFVATGWLPEPRQHMLTWDGLGTGLPPVASHLDPARPEAGMMGVGLAQLLGMCDALKLTDCAERPADSVDADAPAIGDDLAELGQQTRTLANGERQKPSAGEVALELMAASSGGAPNVVRMPISEARRLGERELDNMYVGMPLPLAQRLVFGPDRHEVSALVLQLHHTDQLPATRARVETLLHEHHRTHGGPRLEVRSFMDVQPTYNQIVTMFNTLLGFVAVLMLVVTLFSVANTVNMAVSERSNEIGTLRAIGLTRGDILRLFITEGGLLGLLGGSLGVLSAIALSVWGINRAGLSWTPPGNTTPVDIRVDIAGNLPLCAAIVGMMMLIACLSAWWPARRASRQEIVEALRHV